MNRPIEVLVIDEQSVLGRSDPHPQNPSLLSTTQVLGTVRILGEDIPLKDNLAASFRRYWFLWLVLLLTASVDFLTTLLFMRRDGIQTEMNDVVRWLASHLGIIPGALLGKSLQIVAAMGFSSLSSDLARATLLLILLLNIVAVIGNLT